MPPRLARLLAIIAAIALVAGAFVLRGALSDNDDESVGTRGSGSAGTGSGEPRNDPDATYRVLCDEDLGPAACDAIGALDAVDGEAFDVVKASEAITLLTQDSVPFDAWVTLDPWPAILDVARDVATQQPVTRPDPVLVASADVVLLTADGDVGCPDPAPWSCLAEQAPAADIGLPAIDTATGPLVVGAAAAGLVGDTDFGRADVVDTPVLDQINALLTSGSSGSLAAQARDIVQPGRYAGIVTVEGRAERTAGTTQGQDRGLTPVSVEPSATLGVVLAGIGPDGDAAVRRMGAGVLGQTVTDALAEAGWAGDAAETTGLPDADVLYALDEEFG